MILKRILWVFLAFLVISLANMIMTAIILSKMKSADETDNVLE